MKVHPSEPDYDVIIERNVRIPMRDGVKLAMDIYHPSRQGRVVPGRFPVILERTPYDKADPERMRLNGEWYCRQGYVVTIQDVRGRYESEGTFYPFKDEGPDGYDTVEWIGRQSWCNGRIGTIGTSYGAWVQSALACHNPAHLGAIFHNQGAFNGHHQTLRHGGAFEMRYMAYAFFMAACSREAASDPVVRRVLTRVRFSEWLSRLPLKEGHSPLSLVPGYEKWLFDWYTHSDYDEYWKGTGYSVEENIEGYSDAPAVYAGGWYDSYTLATTQLYSEMVRRKKGPIRMIIGPWTHGYLTWAFTYAGEVDFGPAAVKNYNETRLRWFDRWLKGIRNGAEDDPPVEIFVMGGGDGRRNRDGRINHGGRWRSEKDWPLKRTRFTKYHLHGDESLSTDEPSRDEQPRSYIYDPRNPVPTIGANISSHVEISPALTETAPFGIEIPITWSSVREIVRPGPYDQRERPDFYGCRPPYAPLAARDDVLTYMTEPLKEKMEVTGPIEARLSASSSALDTDFTAKLIDQYPPNEDHPHGFAMNLSDSIIRARYRKSWEKAEPMEPGRIYELRITLYPTSNLFTKGHRIRLDISSSNFPRFDANPNTGEPIGRHRGTVAARNTIYHDPKNPSYVVLPIIPS